MTIQLCRRCRFHPESPRIAGYCSWDCHDADDEEEADEEATGGRREGGVRAVRQEVFIAPRRGRGRVPPRPQIRAGLADGTGIG